MTENKQTFMNEASASDWDKVPFPARQQLGDHGSLMDARSGNGINASFGSPDTVESLLREVTYHLGEATSPSSGRIGDSTTQREVPNRDARVLEVDRDTPTSQRSIPNRDERIAQAGAESSDTMPSSEGEGDVQTADSDTPSVPDGTVNEIMAWVGDDRLRARAAIEAERCRQHPRQTLLTQLDDKV